MLEHSTSIQKSSRHGSSLKDTVRTQFASYGKHGSDGASKNSELNIKDKPSAKKIKAILGVVGGLLIGVVLFLLAVFSFEYSYFEAGVIVSVITIPVMLGLALSVYCRCIVILVLPSFLTGRGRALLLSVLFSLLLTHSFSNIVYNAKETGNSMACIVDLAANQSRQLQQQLLAPYKEMSGIVI